MNGSEHPEVWGGLKHAWREFRVARLYGNGKEMIEAAVRIRMLQEVGGVRKSTFKVLELSWPSQLDEVPAVQ